MELMHALARVLRANIKSPASLSGLFARLRHRVGYVWWWRLKYWWLDTRHGLQAQITLALLGLIGVSGASVRMFFIARTPVDATHPQQSVIGVIIVLIIALLVAVIALASMPKPKPPQPNKADTPTTEDGQSVQDHGGTVWVDDSFILAWRQMGTEAIQSSGGKK